MSYSVERDKVGRQSFTRFEVDLPVCRWVYGEQVTNLLTYSEQIDHADWSKLGSGTTTANDTTAPDETTTADKINDTGSGNNYSASQSITVANDSSNYFPSIYIKQGTSALTRVSIGLTGGTSVSKYVDITWSDLSLSGDLNDLKLDYINDDWYRLSGSVANNSSGNTSLTYAIYPSYIVGGSTTGYIYAWGAQLVIGSAPGGYVLTTAASATDGCTAAGAVGSECYNTNNTCQDLANYSNDLDPKTITICDKDISIVGYPMHPLLETAQLSPTKIVKNKALGKRAQITLTCLDEGTNFAVDDADLDPYWATRTYSPQGSFWRKLKAIFKYYNGSALRVKTGYIANPYDSTDCVTRNYILDDIQGPDKSGRVKLIARDILKLADDKRAKWPVATTGNLAGALTAGSTASFTLTNGAGQYTDAGAYIRIGDEVIQYTSGSNSGDDYVIAGTITRGAYGTTAATHELGDTAQLCYELNATNIVDFLETLVFTAAGITSSYKAASWATEKAVWFTSTNLTGLITKSEGVTSIIEGLQENHALFYIWHDEISQLIELKAVSPTSAVTTTLKDGANILEVLNVKEGSGERLTRSYVLFGPHNPVETDDFQDYKTAYVTIDADAENAAQYGDIREGIAKARFFTSEGLAVQFGARKLARYRDPPKIIELILDAKDTDLWTGDITYVDTRYLQDVDGSNKVTLMQVFSVQELAQKQPGTHYKYELVDTVYQGRYGRIMSAAASSVYSSATDDEKANGCYIASAGGGDFSDTGGAYKIV